MPTHSKFVSTRDGYMGPIELPHEKATLLKTQKCALEGKYGVRASVRYRRNLGCRALSLHGEPSNLHECSEEAVRIIKENIRNGVFVTESSR